MKALDINAGDKFYRLTIVSECTSPDSHRAFLCRCECENELVVRLFSLKSGNTKSCGCLRDEKSIERNIAGTGSKRKQYIKRSKSK